MDKDQREDRTLQALELLAEEVEKLRMLREHELCVKVVEEDGALYVRLAGEG